MTAPWLCRASTWRLSLRSDETLRGVPQDRGCCNSGRPLREWRGSPLPANIRQWLVASPPPHRGSNLGQDRFDHMGVVGNAELVGDGQEQRIGFRNGLVLFELFDQHVRLGGVA